MTGPTKEYQDQHAEIAMERRSGILHIRFHSRGESFRWSATAHRSWAKAFRDITSDRENRVLIMSGTGAHFCTDIDFESFKATGSGWDVITTEGKHLIDALLGLEIPVVAVVRGGCTIHAEIPLLSDIVLATENAWFGDDAHFARDVVPGHGTHVLWTSLLGVNRSRHLVFAQIRLNALEAQRLGVVAEVISEENIMARAWELAEQIARRPSAVTRYTREAMIRPLRKAFEDSLSLGFALQGAARLPGNSA